MSNSGALKGGTLSREIDRLRLANPHPADRRYIDASLLHPNPLGDTKRLPCRSLFLKLGETSPAHEEVDIGAPEIGQRLLQHLRIKVIQPQLRLFELGELG